MANELGLPNVPQGLDRELSSFLNQLRTLVLRNAKLLRNTQPEMVRTKDIADKSITTNKIYPKAITKDKLSDDVLSLISSGESNE